MRVSLPFTVDQFFLVFRAYNETVWPVQLLLNILAVIAIISSFRPFRNSDRTISLILSLLWLWMGIVYHLGFFAPINPAALFFGVAFICQGILLLRMGIKNRVRYRFTKDAKGIIGVVLIGFALILYPVLGYVQNHCYPSSPTFGVPCPTTIFTFGLFVWSSGLPRFLLIIPGLWSLIGFSAAFAFGVTEDIGLLVSGLIAIPLILRRTSFVRESFS